MNKVMGISILCMVSLVGLLVSGVLAAEINATTYALEMTPFTQVAQGIQGQQLPKSPLVPKGAQGIQSQSLPKSLPALIKATPGMFSAHKYNNLSPEFKAFKSNLDNAYTALQQAWPSLASAYSAYTSKMDECINKAYTYADQQAAGCGPNDSVNICLGKLVNICSETAYSNFMSNSSSFNGHLGNISWNEEGMKGELKKIRDWAQCRRNCAPGLPCQCPQ